MNRIAACVVALLAVSAPSFLWAYCTGICNDPAYAYDDTGGDCGFYYPADPDACRDDPDKCIARCLFIQQKCYHVQYLHQGGDCLNNEEPTDVECVQPSPIDVDVYKNTCFPRDSTFTCDCISSFESTVIQTATGCTKTPFCP